MSGAEYLGWTNARIDNFAGKLALCPRDPVICKFSRLYIREVVVSTYVG